MTFAARLSCSGYLLGSCPWGYWLVRAHQPRGHPQGRLRQHRRDERLADVRPLARRPGRAARHGQGLRPGAARDALRLALCRDLRRRRGDARPLAAALPALREGREDGRDLRRRLLRRRRLGGADRAASLARRLPALPLRVGRLDRRRASRCRSMAAVYGYPTSVIVFGARSRRRDPLSAPRQPAPPPRRHRASVPASAGRASA